MINKFIAGKYYTAIESYRGQVIKGKKYLCVGIKDTNHVGFTNLDCDTYSDLSNWYEIPGIRMRTNGFGGELLSKLFDYKEHSKGSHLPKWF